MWKGFSHWLLGDGHLSHYVLHCNYFTFVVTVTRVARLTGGVLTKLIWHFAA